MEYKKEFSVYQFPWWSGARDTIKDIENAEKMDELQTHLEEIFADGEVPTDTDIRLRHHQGPQPEGRTRIVQRCKKQQYQFSRLTM